MCRFYRIVCELEDKRAHRSRSDGRYRSASIRLSEPFTASRSTLGTSRFRTSLAPFGREKRRAVRHRVVAVLRRAVGVAEDCSGEALGGRARLYDDLRCEHTARGARTSWHVLIGEVF